VGLEENPYCIHSTMKTLGAAGHPAQRLLRGTPANHGNRYRIDYVAPEAALPEKGALLIEGLFGYDDGLEKWLLSQGPFDAIVCWLVGAQQFMGANVVFAAPQLKEYVAAGSKGLRLAVQNRTYELADELLRPGGVLHVVDRGEIADTEILRADVLRAHRDQAGPTSLQVERLDTTPWDFEATEVQMVFTPGESGRVHPKMKPGLNSVISRKP